MHKMKKTIKNSCYSFGSHEPSIEEVIGIHHTVRRNHQNGINLNAKVCNKPLKMSIIRSKVFQHHRFEKVIKNLENL